MSIKNDCFAYKSDNLYDGCNALKMLYCKKNENCKFYKNKKNCNIKKSDIYEK